MSLRKRKEVQAVLRPVGVFWDRLILLLALPIALWGDPAAKSFSWDEQFSSLVATDSLGRSLPGGPDSGPIRSGKYVGVFYFLWHGEHEPSGPWDLSKILAKESPEYGPHKAFHHWAEPELGYYLSSDPYVFEVHAEWLSAARVDTIVIDVSNGHTYAKNVETLCQTWKRLRDQGNPTPQIAFLAHTNQSEVVRGLYDSFYADGRYEDLWFSWDGKPLILASKEGLDPEVLDFFTFRESWAWSQTEWFGDGKGKWPWLDNTPQTPGLSEEGVVEQISVSVAQHATSNIGRSYSRGRQPEPAEQRPERGIYFAEQWKRALEVDPPFVFITGWNEWVAQRFLYGDGPWSSLAGTKLGEGDSVFVDAYNEEYSRDIEPMAGGFGRNYYYQMVAGIRRFKGAADLPQLVDESAIAVDGDPKDWSTSSLLFKDFSGEALSRKHPVWGGREEFLIMGGKNDFRNMSVARDSGRLCFLLECSDTVSLGLRDSSLSLTIKKVGDELEGEVLVRVWADSGGQAEAEIISFGNVRAGDDSLDGAVSVASKGRFVELSIDETIFEGAEVLGFRWNDLSSPGESNTSELTNGDSAPIADYFYGFRRFPIEFDRETP